MNIAKSVLIAGLFITQAVLCTVLAWNGSKFSLITLAVTTVFLAVFTAFYSMMLRSAHDGWNHALRGCRDAQQWGLAQETILRDALQELVDYDDEAVVIHSGRSREASLEYIKTFEEEDAAYIAEAIREELNG